MITNVTPEPNKENEAVSLGSELHSDDQPRSSFRANEAAAETLDRQRPIASVLRSSASSAAITLKNVILRGHSNSVITYGAYVLRATGLIIAFVGIFTPVVETGFLGAIGWLVDLVINALIGFACFVIAEVALTIREISEKLRNDSDRNVTKPISNETESSSEGY